MARLSTLLMVVAVFPLAHLGAQRATLPPIDTDRPDYTDGTGTIPRGHAQFEFGYSRTHGRTDTDSPRLLQSQEGLLRVGVGTRLELRLSQNFLTVTPNTLGSSNLNGLDDLGLGAKIALAEQVGATPSLSIEAGAHLPTGRREVAAHKFLPAASLLLGWAGAGPWSLGVALGGERIPDDHLQFDLSSSLKYAATARAQLYAEWYTFQPMPPNEGRGEHYFNSGLQYLLGNNTQLDARVGFGLNHAASRNFYGLGVSLRR